MKNYEELTIILLQVHHVGLYLLLCLHVVFSPTMHIECVLARPTSYHNYVHLYDSDVTRLVEAGSDDNNYSLNRKYGSVVDT